MTLDVEMNLRLKIATILPHFSPTKLLLNLTCFKHNLDAWSFFNLPFCQIPFGQLKKDKQAALNNKIRTIRTLGWANGAGSRVRGV